MENLPDGWQFRKYEKKKRGDVIYIQKLISGKTIRLAQWAKEKGIPLIYDRDDFRSDWKAERYNEIIDIASAVTTDTTERARLIRRHTKTPVYVVPDCIDYGITKEARMSIRPRIKNIVTYGYWKGVESVTPYFNKLRGEKWYICDRKIPELRTDNFIRWNRKKFVERLGDFDLVILTHRNNDRALLKSNNRLITAMALGIPVLVMRSPSYERTLKDAGCFSLLIDSPDDIKRKMEDLKDQRHREDVSNRLFDYAWKKYRPEISAKKLVTVMNKFVEGETA